MAGLLQHHPALAVSDKRRDHTIEIARERCLREQQVQLADHLHRPANIGRMRTELIRNLAQDAKDFALLFFAQPHEFVVEIDGIQRLDEQRLTAAACAMDNAVDPPLLPGNHRDDEPIVSNRDVLFLQYALVAVRLQESFERLMNRTLLLIDVPAQPVERDARIIGNRPVRKHLAPDLAEQPAEIRHHLRSLGQQRKLIALRTGRVLRPLARETVSVPRSL